MSVGAIVTAPPYAEFLGEVATHPLVRGLRLNTVMPVRGGPAEALRRLSGLGQPVWVDLKGRQLRVVGGAIPPFTELRLSHPIQVRTPVVAYFGDGREVARVMEVDGDRLILEDGPRRYVGPGESVNIPDASLRVLGTLTETDRAYLEAMRATGLPHVMLSFVESLADVEELRALLPSAEIVLKIESSRGMDFARRHGAAHGRLMAARGDLYLEIGRPHRIAAAVREILAKDPQAIAASRILESLARGPEPECADVGDAAFLLGCGYHTLLLGDAVCLRRESVLAALNLLEELARNLG